MPSRTIKRGFIGAGEGLLALGGGRTAPDPEEIGDHTPTHGNNRSRYRRQSVIPAQFIAQNNNNETPKEKTAEVSQMILPTALPGGAGVAKDPGVVDGVTGKSAKFRRQHCSPSQGQTKTHL